MLSRPHRLLPVALALGLSAAALPAIGAHRAIPAPSREAAIERVVQFTGFNETALPPRSVEAVRAGDKWLLAFETFGSGRPGILYAFCFAAYDDGRLEQRGRFRNRGVAINHLKPDTCAPL